MEIAGFRRGQLRAGRLALRSGAPRLVRIAAPALALALMAGAITLTVALRRNMNSEMNAFQAKVNRLVSPLIAQHPALAAISTVAPSGVASNPAGVASSAAGAASKASGAMGATKTTGSMTATGSMGAAASAKSSAAMSNMGAVNKSTEESSTIGSIVAMAVLFLAFMILYGRWLLTRRQLARALSHSHSQARSDALTGLANRRAFIETFETILERGAGDGELCVSLYDLNGFKGYNDNFGHLAGDALLSRLGERLRAATADCGSAYRLGGDEFCTVICASDPEVLDAALSRASGALHEQGEGFEIDCSVGSVMVPAEASSADSVLALADQRMYESKFNGRISADRQIADVLLSVLRERDGNLGEHLSDVAKLVHMTALRLGVGESTARRFRIAAELHDVGKSAVPDAILNKPGPLDDEEWAFMRTHTLIGERIVRAAPALTDVAELVRASHERVDGCGYPDRLAGERIPLGARIIAVCDSFDAMIAERPYRPPMCVADALAELRRCRGSQFDGGVVDVFCAMVQSSGQSAAEDRDSREDLLAA